MAELLDDRTIEERLAAHPAWRREGDEIVTDRELADFAAAMAFVNAGKSRLSPSMSLKLEFLSAPSRNFLWPVEKLSQPTTGVPARNK